MGAICCLKNIYIKSEILSILDFLLIPHQEHEISQDNRKYE